MVDFEFATDGAYSIIGGRYELGNRFLEMTGTAA